jgi:hypothetical protein
MSRKEFQTMLDGFFCFRGKAARQTGRAASITRAPTIGFGWVTNATIDRERSSSLPPHKASII